MSTHPIKDVLEAGEREFEEKFGHCDVGYEWEAMRQSFDDQECYPEIKSFLRSQQEKIITACIKNLEILAKHVGDGGYKKGLSDAVELLQGSLTHTEK